MNNNDFPQIYSHPYMPNSVPWIRDAMLKTLGMFKLEDLITVIPDELKYKEKMKIPKGIQSEFDLKDHFEESLSRNISRQDYLNFLGAVAINIMCQPPAMK